MRKSGAVTVLDLQNLGRRWPAMVFCRWLDALQGFWFLTTVAFPLMKRSILASFLGLAFTLAAIAADKPRNISFILSDDHRWDFFHFMPEAPKFLETPNFDRLAREGVNFRNMFVSTSLCSPSRASILTGLYMHHHHVADNQHAESPDLRYFPEYLQGAGYETAFLGKWHMGEDSDAPRKGFNYWAAFRGQGEYFDPVLDINGERKAFKGYNTDILTDLAIDWLKQRHEKPFFMYLAYKAPHFPFEPAPRDKGRYEKEPVPYPPTMANTEQNYETQPRWVRERRYSIHGVDHMETGRFDNDPVPSFENLYHRYAEAVYSTDEDVGRLLKLLDDTGLSNSTLILYMATTGSNSASTAFTTSATRSRRACACRCSRGRRGSSSPARSSRRWCRISTSLHRCWRQPVSRRRQTRRRWMAARSGRCCRDGDALARPHPLRILLGVEFPGHAHHVRAAHRPLEIHLLLRDLGQRRVLRPANGPAGESQLDQRPGLPGTDRGVRTQLFDEMEKSGGLELPIRPPSGEVLDDRKLLRFYVYTPLLRN